MVKVTLTTSALLLSFLASASATKINFVNKCATPVELYHSERFEKLEKLSDIAAGASYSRDVTGTAHMFRHGFDTDATLVEFSMPNDGKAWYDISVIPPMPGHCRSFEECKQVTGKRGFNLPVNISPKQNANAKNCRALACPADDKEACADAYHFPDDVKTHDCPASTEFDVVFCPSGSGGGSNNNGGSYGPAPTTQAPAQTPAANNNNNNNNNNNQQQQKKKGSYSNTGSNNNNNNNGNSGNSNYGFNSANGQSQQGTVAPASDDTVSGEAATLGKVRATYTYKGKQAGNVPGSYDRVTKLSGCVKEKVSLNSPVGPLSEEVSLVFRGPMDVYNIAVFDGSGGNSTFSRVSSYDRSTGDADNLVFMNNKNIDYSGKGSHGPQGYATEDGASKSDAPCKKFKGLLKEASDPNKVGGGPGIQTGVEVNIMTAKKCNGDCLGYHGDNDHHGWGGGRKVFVTKVQMPHGAKPNQPALWMLNAQVLHSNQYGCNCRGVGAVGGCGELDIAEVIETNDARDRVTTHHYFYDGSILSPGGDNFAARPVDKAVTYVTLIDDRDGGMIKIAEVEDFDYSKKELSSADIQQLLDA